MNRHVVVGALATAQTLAWGSSYYLPAILADPIAHGLAQGFVTLAAAWAVLGVGMPMGLCDPAFAALTGLYGRAARGPITDITLIAGLRARWDGRYRPFSTRNLAGARRASFGRRCTL